MGKFSIYNIQHDSNCPNLTRWVCWSSLCPSAGFVCLGGPFAAQSGCPGAHAVATALRSGPAASQTLCRDLKRHLDQNETSTGPGNTHIFTLRAAEVVHFLNLCFLLKLQLLLQLLHMSEKTHTRLRGLDVAKRTKCWLGMDVLPAELKVLALQR